MDRNQLTELPASIALEALTELNVFELTELPASIGQLGALTALNVYMNQLTELPASIGSCARSRLPGGNQLTELPASIGQLGALTELNVDRNQLTELPASIGQLGALTKLSGREPADRAAGVDWAAGRLRAERGREPADRAAGVDWAAGRAHGAERGQEPLTELPASIGQLGAPELSRTGTS